MCSSPIPYRLATICHSLIARPHQAALAAREPVEDVLPVVAVQRGTPLPTSCAQAVVQAVPVRKRQMLSPHLRAVVKFQDKLPRSFPARSSILFGVPVRPTE